jgi:hypothetical protein
MAIMKIFGFFFIRCASPLNRVKIATLIVMVQHKGHERIGKAWKQYRTLPIGPKIAI